MSKAVCRVWGRCAGEGGVRTGRKRRTKADGADSRVRGRWAGVQGRRGVQDRRKRRTGEDDAGSKEHPTTIAKCGWQKELHWCCA
jgi:hypothetical protein